MCKVDIYIGLAHFFVFMFIKEDLMEVL